MRPPRGADLSHPCSVVDDLEGGNPGEVRRRVVQPVVWAMFGEDELDSVEVTWAPPPGYSPDERDDAVEIWVRLVACGEEFAARLTKATDDLWDAKAVAADLADALEDWLCETRFGGGQQRAANYVVRSECRNGCRDGDHWL